MIITLYVETEDTTVGNERHMKVGQGSLSRNTEQLLSDDFSFQHEKGSELES